MTFPQARPVEWAGRACPTSVEPDGREDDTVSDQDWGALAAAVRDRRLALGLRQGDLEALGGPSQGTVKNIEQGARTKYAQRTFARLETALGWPPGAVDRIFSGKEPEPLADDEAIPEVERRGPVSGQDWGSLGRQIKARREVLRLPQDLVNRGGPSEFTIRRLERGEADAIRPKTKRQLEDALQWRPGLVDRILDGEASDDEASDDAAVTPTCCACQIGSPAWIERELATERRINALARTFQEEITRLLALVDAARKANGD